MTDGNVLAERRRLALVRVDDTAVLNVGAFAELDPHRVLAERARPKLKGKLRLAAFSWEAPPRGEHGTLARFVAGLASGQAAHGHDAFVFAPANAPSGTLNVSTAVAARIRHSGSG